MADDLTSNTWVWVPDKTDVFVKGNITDYLPNGMVRVSMKNGVHLDTVEILQASVEPCNPTKFNLCEDMAELTHLNEPLVIYNLHLRYNSDDIYTYLGLFLVAINPYKALNIYDEPTQRRFRARSGTDPGRMPPHIFALAETTHRNMVDHGKNQLILVTGESGAGKTENTKKVIQYLLLLATGAAASSGVHEKILRANPILELFGNAKTIKNNNSLRFGKFIKMYFDGASAISGATIDYYLLEKLRVLHQLPHERNYHVFYQILAGEPALAALGLLPRHSDYRYLRLLAGTIPNVDDALEYAQLKDAFRVMGFLDATVAAVVAGLAVVLHLGNVDFALWKAEQASFAAGTDLGRIAGLLGIDEAQLAATLLKPKVKAGREYVQRLQRPHEVRLTVDAFAKHLYELLFQFVIAQINQALHTAGAADSGQPFIGVLDIAGFEIFEINSFEQLCINYTNEKLQQYFNHHSFILEQSEYLREDIAWEYIDFGLDLQPTIDLIEKKQPMGILEILNEQCILPKASEETFIAKLLDTCDSKQFLPNKVRLGFIIDHYAGPVEYNIDDWLQKNRDPVSEHLVLLMLETLNEFMRELFAQTHKSKSRLKMVTQKHKEQLACLMDELESTEPHFVRCILPNLEKKCNKFDKRLVLSQLRCNGVLEGIRIARAGYPNKMTFDEFFDRYLILNTKDVFTKNTKSNCELVLEHIGLDETLFRVGITKLFFKNGILGHLEELRDAAIKEALAKFQRVCRGQLVRRGIRRDIAVVRASQVIARNFRKLDELVTQEQSPWLRLFVNLKPLLEESVKVLDTSAMKESLRAINTKLKETEGEKTALEAENASLKERLATLEDEIISTQASVAEKMAKLKALEREESLRSQKLLDSARELADVKAVSEVLSRDKALLTSKVDETQRSLEAAEAQLALLEAGLKAELEKAAALKKQADALEHEKTALGSAKADLQAKHDKLQNVSLQYDAASKELELVREKCRTLELVEADLKSRTAELETTRKQLDEAKSQHTKDLDSSNKHAEDLAQKTELVKVLEATKVSLEKERDELAARLKKAEDEVLLMRKELESAQREAASAKEALVGEQAARLKSVEAQLQEATAKITVLETEVQEKRLQCSHEAEAHRATKRELESMTEKLQTHQQLEEKLQNEEERNRGLLADLEALKKKLTFQIETQRENVAEYERMKHEVHFLLRTKTEYADQIAVFKDQVARLEHKLQDKENVPPKVDPNLMSDYINVKNKLNEQSAIIRTEKFENQKLLEEVRMLRQKVHESFESPSKRSEARRSVADPRADTKNLEEIQSLKVKLQQEEANAARAENYAIELQKKLNHLQAARSPSVGTNPDYEARLRQSQSRIEQLESRLAGAGELEPLNRSAGSTPEFGSRLSLGPVTPNPADFAKIYSDINLTLKATREELGKSKSEILRLKVLLRESEDELYEMKRTSMKTLMREYEEQVARLKVENETVKTKNAQVVKLMDKYKARSEEYYEKWELADSAVAIATRREQDARRELEEKTTELRMAKEEVRAAEWLVKQLRQDKTACENKIAQLELAERRAQEQARQLQEQLKYLHETYGDRKRTMESHREEMRALHGDLEFKLSKETEMLKENQLLKLENDELARIKTEVLAENAEVAAENEALAQSNEDYKRAVAGLQNDKKALERKLEQHARQVESLRGIIEDNGRQLESLHAFNRDLEATKSRLEGEVADLQDAVANAERTVKIVQEHGATMEQERQEMRAELDELRSRWDSSDGHYKQARKENLVIVQENESLKAVNSELAAKVRALEDKLYSNEQLKYLEGSMSRMGEEVELLKHQLQESGQREEQLAREISTLKYDVDLKTRQLKKYNDENFNYQNTVGQFRGKIEFLYQENNDKDLKIKAQERELAALRDQILQEQNRL